MTELDEKNAERREAWQQKLAAMAIPEEDEGGYLENAPPEPMEDRERCLFCHSAAKNPLPVIAPSLWQWLFPWTLRSTDASPWRLKIKVPWRGKAVCDDHFAIAYERALIKLTEQRYEQAQFNGKQVEKVATFNRAFMQREVKSVETRVLAEITKDES